MLRGRLALTILALIAAIAAVGTGHARGAAPVAGEVVICTGAGVVTIAVDADGTPVARHAPCPDCTLTAPALPGPPATAATAAGATVLHRVVARAAAPAPEPARGPPARAPPRSA